MATQDTTAQGDMTVGLASCQNSQGVQIRANLLRLTRYQAALEIYNPAVVLRTSEVLTNFQIVIGDRPVYSGRAVISSLINLGSVLVCEASLEDSWREPDLSLLASLDGGMRAGFAEFLQQWQKNYKVRPEFKVIVADLQTFLTDLRFWLDQVELGIRSSPSADRLKLEQETAAELGESTTPALTSLFEKFESCAQSIEKALQPAHQSFSKRQLHPLLLCSPFLYRTYSKPLGYAGDYEMVNMICRDPLEGSTLFAKIVNLWFLRQPPAEAHRNRIQFLMDRIAEVTASAAAAGRKARILSIGCGPATEVQRFLAEKPFSDRAQFTLLDFNEETVEHCRSVLEGIRQKHRRNAQIQVVKKSVNQILKEAGRSVERAAENQHDLVYCAGLFDYLSDQMCHRLSNILYEWVAPGGLFLFTNVDSSNPRRLIMDYIMDWHLIYRRGNELAALKPERVTDGEGTVTSDSTGVNIHYIVRKPERA